MTLLLSLQNRIIAYAKKYKHLLTENEYKTLTQKTYKISNFYMLPKLYKSKELNDIILAKNSEYIRVDKILTTEGRPIVARPCYHISVVSQILHVIMEPTLSFIKHILKDSFDFIDRIDTQCTVNTILSTCDIKSLYTNIQHDVFYKAILDCNTAILNTGLTNSMMIFHYFHDLLKHLF